MWHSAYPALATTKPPRFQHLGGFGFLGTALEQPRYRVSFWPTGFLAGSVAFSTLVLTILFTNRHRGTEIFRDQFHGAKVAITNLSETSRVQIRVTLCP